MIYKVAPDELYHYGTIGMKWGIRRYQNPDGSLTPLGRERARKLENAYDARTRKRNKDGSRIDIETDKKARKIREDYDLLTDGKDVRDQSNRHNVKSGDEYYSAEEIVNKITQMNLKTTLENAKNNYDTAKAKNFTDKAAQKAAKLDAKIAIKQKEKNLNELNQYQKNIKQINKNSELDLKKKELDLKNEIKDAKKSGAYKLGEEIGKDAAKKFAQKLVDTTLTKTFDPKKQTFGDLVNMASKRNGLLDMTPEQIKTLKETVAYGPQIVKTVDDFNNGKTTTPVIKKVKTKKTKK